MAPSSLLDALSSSRSVHYSKSGVSFSCSAQQWKTFMQCRRSQPTKRSDILYFIRFSVNFVSSIVTEADEKNQTSPIKQQSRLQEFFLKKSFSFCLQQIEHSTYGRNNGKCHSSLFGGVFISSKSFVLNFHFFYFMIFTLQLNILKHI